MTRQTQNPLISSIAALLVSCVCIAAAIGPVAPIA